MWGPETSYSQLPDLPHHRLVHVRGKMRPRRHLQTKLPARDLYSGHMIIFGQDGGSEVGGGLANTGHQPAYFHYYLILLSSDLMCQHVNGYHASKFCQFRLLPKV